MDYSNLDKYIRTTCSILDFDYGELWCVHKTNDSNTDVQLNTKNLGIFLNPTFKDFLTLSGAVENPPDDEVDTEYHKISSALCQSIYTSNTIMWAHSNLENGLFGRYDLPFLTAVGMPIGSVGLNTYVILYYSIMKIPINPDAFNHLLSMSKIIITQNPSTNIVSSVSSKNIPENIPETSHELEKLIQQYPKHNNFQFSYKYKEIILLCEFYYDYKMKRKGNFTDQQLENLKHALRVPTTTGTATSSSILNTDINNTKSIWLIRDNIQSTIEAKDAGVYYTDDNVDILSNQDKLNVQKAMDEMNLQDKFPNNPLPHEILNILLKLKSKSQLWSESFRHIHAHMTYRLNQTRLHEFMIVVLALSVFDSCELWLLSDHAVSELHLTAAVYRNATMQKWTSSGISLRLQVGVDVPGRVITTPNTSSAVRVGGRRASGGDYCWDPAYCEEVPAQDTATYTAPNTTARSSSTENMTPSLTTEAAAAFSTGTNTTVISVTPSMTTTTGPSLGSQSSPDFSRLRPGRNGPRMSFAKELGIHTAFAVPLPGLCGSSGSLVFYSTKQGLELDPVFIQLVTTAVKLMTDIPAEPFPLLEVGFSQKTNPEKLPILNTTSSTESATAVSSNPSKVNLRSSEDFDQRLQLCQAIITSRRTGGAPVSLNDYPDLDRRVGTALNYHPTQSSKDKSDIDGINNHSENAISVKPTIAHTKSTAAVGVSSIDSTGNSSNIVTSDSTAIDENLYSDAVVNAARALANFGNFKWGTFLEGSGLQDSSDGYQSMRLGSDQLLGVYADQPVGSSSRKRKLPTRPAGSSDQDSNTDGLPQCLVAGCDHTVEGPDVQYCTAHRGTRRCQKDGCGKCAQGATQYCIAHGGGRRCTFPGCFKGARDKLFCAAHGGGKRCTYENCTKSAVGGSALCTAHGGGKRCQYEGCTKSSQSSTDYCVKHGGGRSCIFKGCNKVARGKTDFCAAHGGGVRCKFKGCYKLAVGSTTLCRSHSSTPSASVGHHNTTTGTSSNSSSSSGASVSVMKSITATGQASTTSAGRTTTSAPELGLRNYLNDLVFQSEKLTQKDKHNSTEDSDSSDMDEAQVLYGRSHMK